MRVSRQALLIAAAVVAVACEARADGSSEFQLKGGDQPRCGRAELRRLPRPGIFRDELALPRSEGLGRRGHQDGERVRRADRRGRPAEDYRLSFEQLWQEVRRQRRGSAAARSQRCFPSL